MFILRERETERGGREHRVGEGRDRGRQRIPSSFRTVTAELDEGLKPKNHEIRPEPKSSLTN